MSTNRNIHRQSHRVQQGTGGDLLWFVRKRACCSWLPTFTYFHPARNWFSSGSNETTKNPRTQNQTSDWRFTCGIKGCFNSNCCMHECQWNSVISPNFTVEMFPYCYLPSLFLYTPPSCLVTSDSIRHYQPLFHKPVFHFSCSHCYTFHYIYKTTFGLLRLPHKEQQIICG